jgi:hypothetical protein
MKYGAGARKSTKIAQRFCNACEKLKNLAKLGKIWKKLEKKDSM